MTRIESLGDARAGATQPLDSRRFHEMKADSGLIAVVLAAASVSNEPAWLGHIRHRVSCLPGSDSRS
ncbi:MAG: hypothetical protein R3B96_13625 [Pirellulaceae bacterium]